MVLKLLIPLIMAMNLALTFDGTMPKFAQNVKTRNQKQRANNLL